MAKAGGKSITWILLSEAKARVDSVYQSPEDADQQLTDWLVTRKLRWRSDRLKGSKRDCDPGSGDPKFWREPVLAPPAPGDPVVILHRRNLIPNWDQSCARRRISATSSYTFFRIEVAEEDLDKLLPKVSGARKNVARPSPACIVASELFPGGPPPTMTTPQAMQKLGAEMERRKLPVPSSDTLKRALGRR